MVVSVVGNSVWSFMEEHECRVAGVPTLNPLFGGVWLQSWWLPTAGHQWMTRCTEWCTVVWRTTPSTHSVVQTS